MLPASAARCRWSSASRTGYLAVSQPMIAPLPGMASRPWASAIRYRPGPSSSGASARVSAARTMDWAVASAWRGAPARSSSRVAAGDSAPDARASCPAVAGGAVLERTGRRRGLGAAASCSHQVRSPSAGGGGVPRRPGVAGEGGLDLGGQHVPGDRVGDEVVHDDDEPAAPAARVPVKGGPPQRSGGDVQAVVHPGGGLGDGVLGRAGRQVLDGQPDGGGYGAEERVPRAVARAGVAVEAGAERVVAADDGG